MILTLSIYKWIRFGLLGATAILLIWLATKAVHGICCENPGLVTIAALIIQAILLLVAFVGSLRHTSILLKIFAGALLVSLVIFFFGGIDLFQLGLSIVLILLAILQALLIDKGIHLTSFL